MLRPGYVNVLCPKLNWSRCLLNISSDAAFLATFGAILEKQCLIKLSTANQKPANMDIFMTLRSQLAQIHTLEDAMCTVCTSVYLRAYIQP